MAIKLMGVPGPQADATTRSHTQDLIGVSHAHLRHAQHAREREAADLELPRLADRSTSSIPLDPHLLDFFMQGLWNETQYNPLGHPLLELRALPARRGPGDDVFVPAQVEGDHRHSRRPVRQGAAQLPARQPGRAPWPGRTSSSICWSRCRPTRTRCRSRTPRCAGRSGSRRSCRSRRCISRARSFDTRRTMEFAQRLSMNPWHCIPEHRPLGNQSRARQAHVLRAQRACART